VHWIARRRRRHAMLDDQVAGEDRREICTMRALIALLDEHPIVPPTDAMAPSVGDWPLHARIEHARHLVRLLKTRKHYYLALADDYEASDLQIGARRHWLIVGDLTAVLTVATTDAGGDPSWMDYRITEPTVVAAVRHRFNDAWMRIAPERREKDSVISIIERLLDGRCGG
jgi:hypothetical protein